MQLTALLDALAGGRPRARPGQIPCRVNDPELWFAESPADVEFAKSLCQDLPGPRGLPRRRARAARAVGRLGRRALHRRRRRAPQAAPRAPAQVRGRRVTSTAYLSVTDSHALRIRPGRASISPSDPLVGDSPGPPPSAPFSEEHHHDRTLELERRLRIRRRQPSTEALRTRVDRLSRYTGAWPTERAGTPGPGRPVGRRPALTEELTGELVPGDGRARLTGARPLRPAPARRRGVRGRAAPCRSSPRPSRAVGAAPPRPAARGPPIRTSSAPSGDQPGRRRREQRSSAVVAT